MTYRVSIKILNLNINSPCSHILLCLSLDVGQKIMEHRRTRHETVTLLVNKI